MTDRAKPAIVRRRDVCTRHWAGSAVPTTPAAAARAGRAAGPRREETPMADKTVTRKQLIELLNEDLAREYQAVIAYVIYSQVLKGAQYMKIAQELEAHAAEELQHALIVAKQIDYLGGMPTVTP